MKRGSIKKRAWILFTLCALCCAAAGYSEDDRRAIILSGTVVAGQTVAVLAPFGGAVENFTVRKGDIVSAGESLFSLTTTKVYAPCDGIVGTVRAQVGDETSFLQDRYGALFYIEPQNRFLIKTDTKFAFAADENKLIHVGETVFIGSRNSTERFGAGYVISVDDKGYSVEVTEGNLTLGDSVSLFRKRDFDAESKIGQGTTTLNPNVAITSDGSIFRLYAVQGKDVKRGELLLETVGGSIGFNPLPTNQVLAGSKAVVATVDVSSGANVSKNQVMATLYPVDRFQVAVNVMELDLANVWIGDPVRITLENFYDQEPMRGLVSSIAGSNVSDATETEYMVYIDFSANDMIRLGMGVNVYFNE